MTYNATGTRIRTENLAGQVTTTAWDYLDCIPVGELNSAVKEAGVAEYAYEYAPFGALTISRGESAAANLWRFSSEYAEDDTATVYYNYRHYEPVTGRWMRRDPMVMHWEVLDADKVKDRSDLLLYLRNAPLSRVDSLGLDIYLTSGNKNAPWWLIENYFFHQEICVDKWRVDWTNRSCMIRSERICFSFAAVGLGFDCPSTKWLDENSMQMGGPIRGEVYETGD